MYLDVGGVWRGASRTRLRPVDLDGKLLVNLTRGRVVCDHLAIADKARLRMRGLLGRESLAAGEGMLLQPAPSIHTAFMRFAIDVVFVDGTLRVKKIVPQLKPWRMASAHGAWAVIELAAGETDQREIVIDDQLGVIEVTDRLGAFMANPDAAGWGLNDVTPAETDGTAFSFGNGVSSDYGAAGQNGNGATAQPKVLVIGTDRRFRSVAAALLTRRGCRVTLADRSSNIGQLAEREGADVVVLDAGVSLTDAAHRAAQIESMDRRVGIVVVAEQAEQSFSAMPVLPKWGSFEGLYRAIEGAQATRVRRSANGSCG